MKVDFYHAVHDIVEQYGTIVSRKNLIGYCLEHNVKRPAILRQYRAGRGYFDLGPILSMGPKFISTYNQEQQIIAEPEVEKTDEEIEQEILSRFSSLELMAYGVINGDFRALVVSGNPGVGKTWALEKVLQSAADDSKILFESVRGYVRATGLYRLLYEHRYPESVLMFDDADSIFQDETALNILKAALDTTKKRILSWRSEKVFESEDGEIIPQSFQFDGSVIFISNIDFQRAVAQGSKYSPHLEALMSRSYYLDLNMRSVHELLVRIKSVIEHGDILTGMDIPKTDGKRIMGYIIDNQTKLRELSLRTVIKLGNIWKASNGDYHKFKSMADATCCSRKR